MKKKSESSSLLSHFDDARKSLRNLAIRVRSWGSWHDSPLVHDGGAKVAQFLHTDQDDVDSRSSMLKAFAERVAVVSKGTTDPEEIAAIKKSVLESYDVTEQELDAFASQEGTAGYPLLEHAVG